MLIKIASAEVSKEAQIRGEGANALYVPTYLAQNIRRAEILVQQMAERERVANIPGYAEEKERQLKDTKPNVIKMGDSKRPVFVVGLGTIWYEDMKDLGRRTLEKPDPKTNPKIKKMFDIINDIDRASEMNKDRKRGRSGVWHIRTLLRKDNNG